MNLKNFLFAPFKLCTILILGLLILLKGAYQNADETIKILMINLKK
jgi:hypothetical protein